MLRPVGAEVQVYGKDSKAAGQPGALMANPADDEAGSANAFPLRPMTWPSVLGSGLTNGHGIKVCRYKCCLLQCPVRS